jgi:two-component system cell cycle sensor histidine kinase/response regulator CckA
MGTPLRILIVEDSEEDTLLIVRELKRGGFDPIHERVETAEAMKAALSGKTWDLILADYSMPHFSGLDALKLLQKCGIDIPFIIVSGSIGEDTAVSAMKAGAHDYLMKNNLIRLVPAIQQELREAEVRRNLKVSQNALQESEKRYRQVVENATEIIYTVDVKGNFTYANPAGLKVTGYSLAELRSFNYVDLVLPDHRERVMKIYINQFRQRIPTTYVEFPFINKAGGITWFSQNASLIIEDGKVVGFHIIARDITERKKAEEALRQSEERFRQLFDDAPVGYFEYDNQGHITNVNRTELEMLGYTPEEMVGQPVWKFIVEQEIDRQQMLAKLAGTLPPARGLERTYRRKDGTNFPALVQDRLLQDAEGRILGIRATIQDITVRKQAEEALRSEKVWSEAIVSLAPNIVVGLGKESKILIFNKFAEKLTGFRTEEVMEKPWLEIFIPEEMRGQLYGVWDEVVKNKLIEHHYENRIVTKRGDERIISWNNTVLTQNGEFRMVLSIGDDITERKRAEEALRTSEQKYRTLIENVPQKIFLKDKNSVYISCNENYAQDLKIKSDEISGRSDYEFYQKELAEKYRADDKRIIEAGKTEEIEEKYVQNGQEVWVNTIKTPVKDEKGNIVGILGIFWDITERKRAEEMLRMTKFSLEHAPESVLWINSKGQLEYANEEACHILGYSREELISMPIWDIDLNFIAERWSTHWQSLPNRGPTTRESSYRTKDGKIFPVEITGDYIKYGDKEYHVAFARNITERKRGEEALRSSEEKYRNILESIEDGYYEVDTAGNFTFFNDSMCRIYGYPREELMGMNYRQYTDQENAKKLYQGFNKVYRTGESTKEFDWEIIRKDGTKRYVETSVSLIKDPSGNRVGFRGVVRDITERKRAEQEMTALQEQLRQSQKMEAVGRLAGGIAHDFNNLLTVIQGNCQLALMDLRKEDPLRKNIQEVNEASEKAADLTRQLLAFSRKQILEMKVLDLNLILQRLDKMLHRLLGEDIELVTIRTEGIGKIKADPGQIEQVIINLAVNSRDAMPEGGKLTIETANAELDEEYASRRIGVQPGRYVVLSVSDTGVGMTQEVKERVFEPFFTTKEKGKGTGLGLSTVYGIVKQSGGNIWVYTEPGQGTTFKVYFPRVDEPLTELKEEVSKEVPRGNEMVLIVEDEETVRKLAMRMLKGLGYRVLAAPEGGGALLLCEEFKEPIHLILTDVVMPGMSGRKLVDRLKEIHPEMKVLYMSGYTDNAIVHHGVLEEGTNFIQKPFTLDGLARKVREVLDK